MVVHHSPGESDIVFIEIDILNPLVVPQIFVRVLIGSLETICPSCVVQFVWF